MVKVRYVLLYKHEDAGKRSIQKPIAMKVSQTEAIVLAARDYGESDKIITLFTREHGKIGGMARNAKKSRKRFGGSLEIFARLSLQIVLKEGLSRLESADLITVFPHIREDLAKIGYGGYACELVDRMLPEAQPSARLYRLLVSYLEYLDANPAVADDRRFFEVNLLNILGYRIPLENCQQCGDEIEPSMELRYQPLTGGIFCAPCGRIGQKISSETLVLLKKAMSTGIFGKIRFPTDSLREAGEILDAAIASHLNRPLRSLGFLLETLRTEGY